MRTVLILGAIGVLAAAADPVPAYAGTPGHGRTGGSLGRGGLEGHMRRGGSHSEPLGIPFAILLVEARSALLPGEPGPNSAAPAMPTSGQVVGGQEYGVAGPMAFPANHPPAHVVVPVGREDSVMTQPAAPGGATASSPTDSDQASAATAQPNPTASPSSPRPPGAAGPGRPVAGWSSPGLPGPGRPASPRR
jgi:hypothetical protein